MKATILFSSNNLAMALFEDGKERLCSLKGKRIKTLNGSYNGLTAGDEVEAEPTGEDRGLILKLYPRRNSFGRYNEKGRADQAIAANLDLVVCVTSPKLPPFRPRFIDRMAVLAERAGSPFFILMNKIDLGLAPDIELRLQDYERLGYGVLRCSAAGREGLDKVTALLPDKTVVFAGQSGVGKSSILNALVPGLAQRTAEVSEKYDRGKHTTTMAQLIMASRGFRIIDTPGIRRLALRGIPPDELAFCFPEMSDLVSDCALGSRCTHGEEGGCAIREAVKQGEIHPDRYESYLRIREELSLPAEWKRSGVRDPGRRARSLPRARASNRNLSGFEELDGDEDLY